MKIAIIAPSGVPFVVGGAEKLWWGLLGAVNRHTTHDADLIKLPSPERGFWELMESYRAFSRLDLSHFDLVVSTKYPAWMVGHPNHYCYLQHRLRGLYDTYRFTGLPTEVGDTPPRLQPLMVSMERSRSERSELEPFFDRLFRLRDDPALPAHTFAFPGPLARRIVRHLDSIALSPKAIRRYFAISRTVADRPDYFPQGTEVTVIHHPSDLPRFESTGHDYLFTASRLDGPKRLDLLIEAFGRTAHPIELRIAGTGPEESRLRELAAGDDRVRFLGHVSDEEVIRQYAGALVVPFVPYDEDYGLITVEAMGSGKAVLTTADAGGVTELVTHGETGLIADPNADSLGRAIDTLLVDREATRAMGEKARERVASITWERTLGTLIGGPTQLGTAAPGRKRLLVTVDFPVHPPRAGGQSRIFHLYKALAQRLDVTLLTLCEDPSIAGELELAPGLREVRVAKTAAQLAARQALEQELRAAAGDIATLLHHDRTPEYARALAREARACDLLIASHPYLYPAIAQVYAGPLWYEAHNVEYDMKRAVLAESPGAEPYLERVRETEQAVCARADRIIVCATGDADRFAALYGIDAGKCVIVPNGVDTRAVRFVSGEARLAAKTRLGLGDRFAALYIASWHQPNIEGLRNLKAIAADCPDVDFLVVGSVCLHQEARTRPPNLYPLGVLDDAELDALLAGADLALNPIASGSGTNLKMLHYAAAGLPILSTPFGNRGLGFAAGEHLYLEDLPAFAAAILASRKRDADTFRGLATRARKLAEAQYDWLALSERVPL